MAIPARHPSGRPNPTQFSFMCGTVLTTAVSMLYKMIYQMIYSETKPLWELPVSVVLTVPLFYVLYKVVNTVPDHIEKASNFDALKASPKNEEYSVETRKVLPYQTKYCKMVKLAVRGFDHHCLFLQNTIGHGTHHYFIFVLLGMGEFIF